MSEANKVGLFSQTDGAFVSVISKILLERGLPNDAVNWITNDIYLRLSFLDGTFFHSIEDAPVGESFFFSKIITRAFFEIIDLEIELYSAKYGERQDVVN